MFSLFWAFQILITKIGFLAGALVLPFQIISFVASIVTLAVIILPKSGVGLWQLFKQEPTIFWNLYLANAIQSGLGTYLSLIGIALTDAINAGFLVKLSTVTTTIFAWLFLKEKMSHQKILLVVTMLSGAYLLTTKGQMILPRIGDFLILGACLCWSLGNVAVRKALQAQSVDADVATIQKPLAGFPVLLILIGVSSINLEWLGNYKAVLGCCTFSLKVLPYALMSGFFLAMAWIFLYRTLNVSTASYMTLMSMVTPVIVSLLAIIFLGESLIWIQVLGAGMILLSSVLIYCSDIAST
jgi:drug/metabolite transporter (DMT)-like permease